MFSTTKCGVIPAKNKIWTFIGASSASTGATLTFPATTRANDLVLILGTYSNTGSAPSGYTIIAPGSSLNYYRVSPGGESTVASPNAGGYFIVVIFRPNTGIPVLTASLTTTNSATSVVLNSTPTQTVVVQVGSSSSAGTWSATLQSASTVHVNKTSSPAGLFATAIQTTGTSTDSISISNSSASWRNTWATFTIL